MRRDACRGARGKHDSCRTRTDIRGRRTTWRTPLRHHDGHLAEIRHDALDQGDAVRLPGIGRIGVALRLSGEVRPTFRVDMGLRRRMPTLAEYEGTILNRANAGMTLAELVARWDEEHPDDPIELPPGVNLAA